MDPHPPPQAAESISSEPTETEEVPADAAAGGLPVPLLHVVAEHDETSQPWSDVSSGSWMIAAAEGMQSPTSQLSPLKSPSKSPLRSPLRRSPRRKALEAFSPQGTPMRKRARSQLDELVSAMSPHSAVSCGFSDDDDLDDNLRELPEDALMGSPPLPSSAAPSQRSPYHEHGRFLVMDVQLTPERTLVLRLLEEDESIEAFCVLHDDWVSLIVEPGDHIHVIGTFNDDGVCEVTSSQNLVVVHPDILISGTQVTQSFDCARRAVLSTVFKKSGTTTPAMLYGSMLHELFDCVITQERPTEAYLLECISKLVKDYLEKLVEIDQSAQDAMQHLSSFMPALLGLHRAFFAGRVDNLIEFRRPNHPESYSDQIGISTVIDVEETIWSPKFGLKGIIDASVKLSAHSHPRALNVPLELKTGKPMGMGSPEHRAQVILYTLLMSDRYAEHVNRGLLLYLKSEKMIGILAPHDDVRMLVLARNRLATYLKAWTSHKYPVMIQNSFVCKRCPMLDECLFVHAAIENGDASTSGIPALFIDRTSHLDDRHLSYFKLWHNLMTLEEQTAEASKTDIWLSDPQHEEANGQCLCNLSCVQTAAGSIGPSASKAQYEFQRTATSPTSPSPTSASPAPFRITQFLPGEAVVLSCVSHTQYGLAIGNVAALSAYHVEVLFNKRLRHLDEANLDCTFRLDKLNYGRGTVRSNLSLLLSKDVEGSRRRRELIIDLQAPSFAATALAPEVARTLCESSLNEGQRHAIRLVLKAHDYGLILGMPGTGKTSTIVELVAMLVAQGQSVLLTSYQHSAVDNLCLKIKSLAKFPFLRLGQAHRIHPSLHSETIEELRENAATTDELAQIVESMPVVATTCMGINHFAVTKRFFDVCIIDEASQLTEAVCLGPLMRARKFVLVGDHYQLPPLVQSEEARKLGMDTSLFKRLSEAHPQAVATLEDQYRMNQDITLLSNFLTYGHRLRCASSMVAEQQLQLQLDALDHHPLWIQDLLHFKQSVVFVDYAKIPGATELAVGSGFSNPAEASIVTSIVAGLRSGGVATSDIGVIAPYRAHLKLLSDRLAARSLAVECDTVDKFQGRDKECIVASFVRCNTKHSVGELLQDWRRINVLITRAKAKLVMIGSVETLQASPIFRLLIDHVRNNHCLFELPAGARETVDLTSPRKRRPAPSTSTPTCE
eukprot:m.94370 g.94370  ORF g.94370 m.94370 type:complete len:1178 (+) comp8712_c0_seq8:100-3633(+)